MGAHRRVGSILKFVPLHEQRSQHEKNTAQEEHEQLREKLLGYLISDIPKEALALDISPELRVVRCSQFFTDSLTRFAVEVFEPTKDEPKNVISHLYLYYEFTSLLCEQIYENSQKEPYLHPRSSDEVISLVSSFFSLFLMVIEKRNLFLRSKNA